MAVVGVVVTAAWTALPFVRFAYRQPEVHIVIDTAVGMIALLLSYLFYGRYRLTGDSNDWVLAGFLAVAGLANVLLSAVGHALSGTDLTFASWAPVTGRLLAASGFFVAGVRASNPMPEGPRRRGWVLVIDASAATAVAALIVAAMNSWLPNPVDPKVSPVSSDHPLFAGAGLTFAVHVATALLYAAAAAGFSRRRPTGLDAWLGPSCALQSVAALNYLLFPSLYSEWLYTGDFFRVAAYAVLMLGAGSEIRAYWARVAEAGAAEERRRVAREFHDGLAQELALVTSHAWLLADRDDDPLARRIASAADRALDEARLAISALTASRDESVGAVVRRAAEDAASRHGVALTFAVDDSGATDNGPARDALVRICREAISNAARHGGAHTVHVGLGHDNGALVLRITDDGHGFDPSVPPPAGTFGLTTMAERARAAGGVLRVDAECGRGTTVEVRVP